MTEGTKKPRARSAWRPVHRTTAKQMQMDVKDGLAGGAVRVHDRSVPVRIDAFLSRNLSGHEREAPEQRRIARLIQRRHMLLRDHEYVDGRLRIDVAERE